MYRSTKRAVTATLILISLAGITSVDVSAQAPVTPQQQPAPLVDPLVDSPGDPLVDPLVDPPGVVPQLNPSLQPDANFNSPGAASNNIFNQPQLDIPSQNLASSLPASFGVTRGSFSASPTMIGDFFAGGLSQLSGSQTVTFEGFARAININPLGGDGQANSTLAFEFGPGAVFDDTFSTGLGTDVAGLEGGADTFSILEPVPPTDAQTAPGPGFTFDGGTAVYTNNTTDTTAQPGVYANNDTWYLRYSFTSTVGGVATQNQAFVAVPAPGVATRRVKLSENFSPEVRDRAFLNYSFFNDAFGGLGDISRYMLGLEKILWKDLISIEARLPLAGTYASNQQITNANDRDFEIGNVVLLGKGVLWRSSRWLTTGGIGVSLPSADDTRIKAGTADLIRIENQTVRVLPFLASMYRPNRRDAFQAYAQIDAAVNGDPVFANLSGGTLPQLGVFNDSTLLHLDIAYTRSLYHNRCGKILRRVLGNTELHYTSTLQDSDLVAGNGFRYENLKNRFNVLNATGGLHFQLANNVVVTPAMSVPLRRGLDKQYDYEAILQLNFLR